MTEQFHKSLTAKLKNGHKGRDIEQLKRAIIEVLDTGFESSERDMALVLDRIDAWEKGTLIKKTSQWGDGNPRLQCRNPDGTLRERGAP